MGQKRERKEARQKVEKEAVQADLDQLPPPATKKLKQDLLPSTEEDRPKSKKELRAERKKAKRAADDPDFAAALQEAEKKVRKKEEEREEFRRILREERREKKLRQQKKMNRDRNAPGGGQVDKGSKPSTGKNDSYDTKAWAALAEVDVAKKIISEIKHGSTDSSGWTTLQLGVKYKDIEVGSGPLVQNKNLLTVKYQLTGGKFGTLIDSSNKFNFRLGKGEVIQGWEIGMSGMREGGRRKLMIPPKAGYGSQDVGAGPGGMLHFDVTVLAMR